MKVGKKYLPKYLNIVRFGDHGLCGLLEEGTQAISDKLNRELPLTRAVCELVVEKMKFAYLILVLVIIQ